MNKPLLLSLAVGALLGTNASAQSMYDRFNAMDLEMKEMKKEIASLKAKNASLHEVQEIDEPKEIKSESTEDEDVKKNTHEEIEDLEESISELNKATSGNHLKLGVNYRFAMENLGYKMADKSTNGNDAFMTNRFWMNMDWLATQNLSFSGQLAYNKAFGQRTDNDTIGYNFENFDWIANENAYDDVLRVRSAYFLYRNDTFFDSNIPWTFSIGRRSSTNGHLINLRDDDKAASPMGHTINVEFDGLSSKFSFENSVEGMYVKLCAGRAMSNAAHKFTSAPYASEDVANPNIDLIGLIFTPYSNGQYTINTQYYYANNLIDQRYSSLGAPTQSFDTVGAMHSFSANIMINGIGDNWGDFLDDSTLFVSGAMTKTDPYDRGIYTGMLGATDSKVGYSGWIGLQTPSLLSDEGRMGIEYNKGSRYWRSITYGEDTNIGSKIAARGDAYEVYFTEYLVEDILSMQLRYTYIDYKYSGSNGFFGNTTGSAMKIADVMNTPMGDIAGSVVDTAQDIRFYIRYKY